MLAEKTIPKLRKFWQYRWLRYLLEAIGVLFIILAVRAWLQKDMLDGLAPDLQGSLLTGEYYSTAADMRRPLLVHFWASWCPVCKFEQQSIQSLHEDYPVITIAMQSGDTSEVIAFMQKEDLNFPVINDPAGVLSSQFGVRAVPSSFIIGNDNTIIFREAGYTTGFGLRLRMWLAQYWQ